MTEKQITPDYEKINKSSDIIAIPRSDKDDIVNNIYKIHLNEEIHDLSNEFCKYYHAANIDNNLECFAIVYDQSFVAPLQTIDFLQKNNIEGIVPVVAWSVTKISTTSTEHLVVIVERYDYNSNLLSHVQKNGPITIAFAEELIARLNKLIHALSSNGIYGYNICPSNILMKDGEFMNLREFIISYPYFHTQDQYIAPELLECFKAARKTNSYKPDIYALGISIFYAYSGKTPWAEHLKPEDYNEIRLEHGTYKYLLSKIKITEALRNFFRWTMNDNPGIRWKLQNIDDWLGGKSGKILHDSIIDNKYMIGFNDHNYSNMKALAYAMFRFWEPATKFIKDSKLFKWAGKQQISNDMLEGIKNIVDVNANDTHSIVINTANSVNKLSKLFAVIDPKGGIRQENIALSSLAIPELLQYLSALKKKAVVEQVIKIMKDQFWTQYSQNDSVGYLDKNNADRFNELATNISLTSPYKGIERLIYSLNPGLPCLSPALDGKYVTNIPELMIALDSHAQKNPKNFNIDRHVIAFIAAKLDLKDDVSPIILTSFPKFAEHLTIRNLSALNILQQHEPSIKLSNVCKVMAVELGKLFEEYLHNTEFKKSVIADIAEASKDGELSDIIAVLSNQQPFINDYNGYYEACRKAKILEERIKVMSNQDGIFNGALILGQKVTVLVSYILCFIVAVTIIL